jgi:GAF domain-containing protein
MLVKSLVCSPFRREKQAHVMSAGGLQPESSAEAAWRLFALTEAALSASSLDDLAARVLPEIADLTRSPTALLYVAGRKPDASFFFRHGRSSMADADLQRLSAESFSRFADHTGAQAPAVAEAEAGPATDQLLLYRLRTQEGCFGLIGVAASAETMGSVAEIWGRLLPVVAQVVNRFLERAEVAGRLKQLNTYLTVSSALTQPLDLPEVLEIALYSCMEAVSATEASVLLLDDQKENFHFYQIEGPAKPVLMGATFPAGKGLAGAVLRHRQSEVINDVRSDPRFYGKVDDESGFTTRNMIALPLVAGDEEVGVLEVVNKADGGLFTEQERLLLDCVAEEIAFAIRNAKVFEYVVNTYCKQRQGHTSCRGCKRPLGSWTPCVKYRDTTI